MSIAHELITRGWTRDVRMNDRGEVCLIGAAYCSVTGNAWSFGMTRQEEAAAEARVEALRRVLGVPNRGYVAGFNDADERTFDEVLRVAKEADELLGDEQ